ncbi:MAG: alpha/beta hydrolase [Pseudomonadota bacterium]
MNAEETVYANFSQPELDAHYNNSAKVANAAETIQWYSAISREWSASAGGLRDISYGEHPSETLDIFSPLAKNDAVSRPVHLFFHGGYWRALHKDDFSFVANAISDTDALCVIVNYGLIPTVSMSELILQCRRSVAWVYRNIGRYGGDENRLSVSGHSAGGHIVAMLAATKWTEFGDSLPDDLIKAGVSLSGLMDLEPIRKSYLNENLDLSEKDVETNSPALLGNYSETDLLCLVGALEGEEYYRQSIIVADRWDHAICEVVTGHDHFSICSDLYDPQSEISQRLKQHCKL